MISAILTDNGSNRILTTIIEGDNDGVKTMIV